MDWRIRSRQARRGEGKKKKRSDAPLYPRHGRERFKERGPVAPTGTTEEEGRRKEKKKGKAAATTASAHVITILLRS